MLGKSSKVSRSERIAQESIARQGLKKTVLRSKILGVLLQTTCPLSQAEIIKRLTHQMEVDRISVYRNLGKLLSVGLIHALEDNSYVACSHACTEGSHILLFCQSCQSHLELGQLDKKNPLLAALTQYYAIDEHRPVYLRGTCKQCEHEAD